MKNNENILILLLVLTACVLGVMLAGAWDAQKAYAASSSDRYGNYIVVTGAMSPTRDLLYVIDVPNKKLLVYYADPVQNLFRIADDRVDFAKVFRTGAR